MLSDCFVENHQDSNWKRSFTAVSTTTSEGETKRETEREGGREMERERENGSERERERERH